MVSPGDAEQRRDTNTNQEPVEPVTEKTPTTSAPTSRSFDRRSQANERRQSILQQKQTDALPKVSLGTANAKVAWRQVHVLHEENKWLRSELEALRAEVQQRIAEHNTLQAEFEKEVAATHDGNSQERAFYQQHLRTLQEEYNKLQAANAQLERNYQALYSSFRESVEQEAHKMVKDAARMLELAPEEPPILLQDVAKTIELHAQAVENTQLVETLHLKRELQRMSDVLAQERQQITEERQQLLIMRTTVREQAQLRYKTIQAHLHLRWRASYVFVIGMMLALLIVLQFVFLSLLHVPLMQALVWALIAPIIICIFLAAILTRPLSTLRHMYYTTAPHKKKEEK